MTVALASLAAIASLPLAAAVGVSIRIPTPRAPLTSSRFPLFLTKEIHLRDGNTGGVAGVSR